MINTDETITSTCSLFLDRKRLHLLLSAQSTSSKTDDSGSKNKIQEANTVDALDVVNSNIENNLKSISSMLGKLEHSLIVSKKNTNIHSDIVQQENDLQGLFKRFEKLKRLNAGNAELTSIQESKDLIGNGSRNVSIDDKLREMNGIENSQLQDIQNQMLLDQDAQLDGLADIIHRQREIGEMISSELDSQARLLEETDQHVDETSFRMRNAVRGVDKLLKSKSKGTDVVINFSLNGCMPTDYHIARGYMYRRIRLTL